MVYIPDIRFKSTHVVYADNHAGIGGRSNVRLLRLVENVLKECLVGGGSVANALVYLVVCPTKRSLSLPIAKPHLKYINLKE